MDMHYVGRFSRNAGKMLAVPIIVGAAIYSACGGNSKADPIPTNTPRPTADASSTPYPTNTQEPTPVPATAVIPADTPDLYTSCRDRSHDYSITVFGNGNWFIEVPADGPNKYRGSGESIANRLEEISNELSQYGIPGVPSEGSVIVERFSNSTRLSYVPRFGEVEQLSIQDLSNDGPTVRYTRNITSCGLA